ncbi:glycogen synthase GlgA [soil metagenome]
MNVVLLASEVYPFAKTGGLADVIGALPAALQRLGLTVSVFVPSHRETGVRGRSTRKDRLAVEVPIGNRIVQGQVRGTEMPGSQVPVYLVEQPGYFDRPGIYGEEGADYPDNCERFVFFQRAALLAIDRLGLRPDVLHCHDWHTGLIPLYLEDSKARRSGSWPAPVGTLLTIHNLAYQGQFSRAEFPKTGLQTSEALEHQGQLNFLKAGLLSADLLNTVSPPYAREIQPPEGGPGLDEPLRARADELRGIVNGIDPDVWNPAIDPHLPVRYNIETFSAGKARCKQDLQRQLGLPERPDVPLLAAIGRLDPQKGWELLIIVSEEILKDDVQLVVLGTGDPHLEAALSCLETRFPARVRILLEFSDALSHRIEAGADLFLMPSLYEPCGLNQLYSLAYGTVPVVRATGGLADTVFDVPPETLAAGTANGFLFLEAEPRSFRAAIDRALTLFRNDPPRWNRLIRSGMAADWTWDRSANAYLHLYDEVRRRRCGTAKGWGPLPGRPSPR